VSERDGPTAEREIARLTQKLRRAEINLRSLEDRRESHAVMHSAIIRQVEDSRQELERKNAELLAIQEQLAMSEREATQASRAKSTFLANMSHELRTPLNAIIGYAQLMQEVLAEQHPDLDVRELQFIELAGSHLLALIDQVLDLSKVEAGKMEIDAEDVPLTDLVDTVTAMIGQQAAQKALALRVCAPRSGTLRTDRRKLTQILFNLLSNAVKFTHYGEVGFEVEVGPEAVRFRVSDTGVGISPEQQARVFQPFEQADLSTTRRYGGTGLGLAIADRFCTLLGGQLALRSRVGQGTEFEFSLPLRA
jgi:signal transduction histidine kinase